MSVNSELYESMAALLSQSQDSAAGHVKLIKKFQNIYQQNDLDEFFQTFTVALQTLMITMQKNPNVDRIVDFIAKFCSSLTNFKHLSDTVVEAPASQSTNQSQATLMETNGEEEDFENPFFLKLIDYLIDISKASHDAVRYRACNMLTKLMSVVNNDQFIDEDLYERLSDALLERLKDINSRVQVQAVSAIYRLQDPNDRECRIIKALQFLMTYDPNWQVRYQALAHIAFSKQTLSDIIDRVRDPNPNCRKKALLILSEKILIKFITIEKRLFILNYSLKDIDESVVEVSVKKLLPSWLNFKENDMCKLLKALDVVDSTDICELMLNKMYHDTSVDTICSDFAHILNEKHVIPLDKLDAESVFYWYWVCSKCKSSVDKEKKSKENADITNQIISQDNLDSLLPSLTEYCEYIQEVIRKIDRERVEKDNDERNQIENTFIIKQIVKMFHFIDFSDVYGKKSLQTLLQNLLSNKNYTFLFDELMKIYKLLYPNVQQRINNIVELISDIKDPGGENKPAEERAHEDTVASVMGAEMSTTVTHEATMANPEPQQSVYEMKLKLSELKFKRYQLKDDFDNIYKEFKNVAKPVDMNRLAELREAIKQCEDEINSLQEKIDNGGLQPQQSATNANNNHTIVPAPGERTTVEAHTTHSEPPIECTFHCLKLALCLLQDTELKNLTPQIRSLFDSLILSNIGSVNEEIRALSVRCLNLVCILKLEMAQKYVPLLLKVIEKDKKEIVLEAFKALINCIMAYSINKLIPKSVDGEEEQASSSIVSESILSAMTTLLDNEDSDIYTTAVEGFCKLYMTGHILSSKLFSKLLIMYYSPLTQNDLKLRACLATFLPQFSFLRPINQLCVEDSFMLTLKCLINAPADSYLMEIDLIKVIETLFHLTNPKNLIQHNKNRQYNPNICHENIAKSICYEILKDENSYKVKTYLKILPMADLNDADYVSLKEIYKLSEEIADQIEDRLLKKTASKFSETLNALLVKKPEYKREQEAEQLKSQDMPPPVCESTERGDETQPVTNQTMPNNEQDTAAGAISSNSSDEMVDPEFSKINKKGGKQLLSKKSNTSSLNSSRKPSQPVDQSKNAKEKPVLKKAQTQSVDEQGKDVPKTSSSSEGTNLRRSGRFSAPMVEPAAKPQTQAPVEEVPKSPEKTNLRRSDRMSSVLNKSSSVEAKSTPAKTTPSARNPSKKRASSERKSSDDENEDEKDTTQDEDESMEENKTPRRRSNRQSRGGTVSESQGSSTRSKSSTKGKKQPLIASQSVDRETKMRRHSPRYETKTTSNAKAGSQITITRKIRIDDKEVVTARLPKNVELSDPKVVLNRVDKSPQKKSPAPNYARATRSSSAKNKK